MYPTNKWGNMQKLKADWQLNESIAIQVYSSKMAHRKFYQQRRGREEIPVLLPKTAQP